METGTSDFEMAMEWYLKFGHRKITEAERCENYPKGSWFALAGVADRDNNNTWSMTPKALKLIEEHNGTNTRKKSEAGNYQDT